MTQLDNAIDRIKRLECPAGDVELRVMGILEGYDVANNNEITIERDEEFDRDEAKAYRVKLSGQEESVVVLAKSGGDDYVAKVVDVTII